MTSDGEQVRAHLIIRGRVQGVYFRGTLKQRAESLGVDGWARNLDDGSVEALLAGPRVAVDAVIAWARIGPPGARVDSVEIAWDELPPQAEARGFEVR
jgi:acylphosphatase